MKLIAILLVICLAQATKLSLGLDSYEKQCFYEILRTGCIR